MPTGRQAESRHLPGAGDLKLGVLAESVGPEVAERLLLPVERAGLDVRHEFLAVDAAGADGLEVVAALGDRGDDLGVVAVDVERLGDRNGRRGLDEGAAVGGGSPGPALARDHDRLEEHAAPARQHIAGSVALVGAADVVAALADDEGAHFRRHLHRLCRTRRRTHHPHDALGAGDLDRASPGVDFIPTSTSELHHCHASTMFPPTMPTPASRQAWGRQERGNLRRQGVKGSCSCTGS